MNYWIFHTVGRRPGFRGTANALQGGSTPPPAAKLSAEKENKKLNDYENIDCAGIERL